MSIKVEDYKLDVIVDDRGFDEVKEVPDVLLYGKDQVRSKADVLPTDFSRDEIVEPFNQGSLGSCVGASGKIIVTDKHYPLTDLSPLWIYKEAQKYDYWAGEDYSGTSIVGACVALMKVGVCEEDFYPYEETGKTIPKLGALDNAKTRLFSNFFKINFSDTDKVKKLIMKESLWTSFHVHSEFYTIGSDGFMKDESNYLTSEKRGGHAVALVGWKNVDGKLFWKFQNSWGKWWANDGYFYVSDELYQKISKGSYYIVSKKEAEENDIEPQVFEKKRKTSFLEKLLAIPKNLFESIKKLFS